MSKKDEELDELGLPKNKRQKKPETKSTGSRRGKRKRRTNHSAKHTNNQINKPIKIPKHLKAEHTGTKSKSKTGSTLQKLQQVIDTEPNIDAGKKRLLQDYKKAVNNLRGRIGRLRQHGFDITLHIEKPETLTTDHIDYLNSLNQDMIKRSHSNNWVTIKAYDTGEDIDLRPKSVAARERDWVSLEDEYSKDPPKRKLERVIDKIPEQYQTPTEEPINPDPLANIEGFRNTKTGEVYDINNPDAYVISKHGHVFYSNISPTGLVLKEGIVPIMKGTMSRDEYEALIKDHILTEFGGRSLSREAYLRRGRNTDNLDIYQDWLEKAIDEYGVFEVRDLLIQANDEGIAVKAESMYNMSEQEVRDIVNKLKAMLALKKADKETMLNMSEMIEQAEGGFDTDYKNG